MVEFLIVPDWRRPCRQIGDRLRYNDKSYRLPLMTGIGDVDKKIMTKDVADAKQQL